LDLLFLGGASNDVTMQGVHAPSGLRQSQMEGETDNYIFLNFTCTDHKLIRHIENFQNSYSSMFLWSSLPEDMVRVSICTFYSATGLVQYKTTNYRSRSQCGCEYLSSPSATPQWQPDRFGFLWWWSTSWQ